MKPYLLKKWGSLTRRRCFQKGPATPSSHDAMATITDRQHHQPPYPKDNAKSTISRTACIIKAWQSHQGMDASSCIKARQTMNLILPDGNWQNHQGRDAPFLRIRFYPYTVIYAVHIPPFNVYFFYFFLTLYPFIDYLLNSFFGFVLILFWLFVMLCVFVFLFPYYEKNAVHAVHLSTACKWLFYIYFLWTESY